MSAATSTPGDEVCFPIDASLCDALAANLGRAKRLRASDVWTLLGLWWLARRAAPAAKSVGTMRGSRAVSFAFRLVELLDVLAYPRRRQRTAGAAEFHGEDWKAVRESLDRLAGTAVEIHYSAPATTSPPARRRSVFERRRFKGSLIALDQPERGVGGERRVTLAIYDGVLSRFFVLVRRRVLDLRASLSETDTRLVLWLARRHRGRTHAGCVQHRWRLRLDVAELSAAGVLTIRRGRPGEARDRLIASCARLADLGVLQRYDDDGRDLHVELGERFFHGDRETAA